MSMNLQFVIVSPDGRTELTTGDQTTLMNSEDLQNLMILAQTSTDDQGQEMQTVELITDEHHILTDQNSAEVQLESMSQGNVVLPQGFIAESQVNLNAAPQGRVSQAHCTVVQPDQLDQLMATRQYTPSNVQQIAAETLPAAQCVMGRKKRRYNTEKTFKCDTCGKKFPSSSNLTRHIRIHTGEKPYKCEYCGKSYAQIDHLKRHEGIHTGNMAYECSVCSKKYQEKFRLVVHMRTHTGERPFRCTLCQKGFTTARALVKHKRWHTGERNYECEFCLKRFVDYAGLCTHRKIHTGEKPHKCSFCSRCFIAKKDLISHERLHTGDLPFQCETCLKKFPRKPALAQHMKTHTTERPFKCKFCDKSFRQKPSLRNHVLIHTNKWPFSCDYCFKKFRRKDSMETHRLKHLDQPPVVTGNRCPTCKKVLKTKRSLQSHLRLHVKANPSDEDSNDACNKNKDAAGSKIGPHTNKEWLNQTLHDYSKFTSDTDDASDDDVEIFKPSSTVSTQTGSGEEIASRTASSSVNNGDVETFPDRRQSFIPTHLLPNIPTSGRERRKSV